MLRTQGSGVRSLQGPRAVLSGVCALWLEPCCPLDPGPLPVLKAGSDCAGGPGQGNLYFTDVLGQTLPLGPRGAAAGASCWAVGSGWPRACASW